MGDDRVTDGVQRGGRHRKPPAQQPYWWFGPAALIFGGCTVLFGGTAVAHADDAASASSASAGTDTGTATSPQTRPDSWPPARGRGERASRHSDPSPGAAASSTAMSGRAHSPLPLGTVSLSAKRSAVIVHSTAASPTDSVDGVVSPPDIAPISMQTAQSDSSRVQNAVNAVEANAAPAAAVKPAVAAVTPRAPQPVVESAAAAIGAAPGSVTAIDTALTPGVDPLAPAAQAVSTVMLAGVRREFSAAPAAAAPAPAAAGVPLPAAATTKPVPPYIVNKLATFIANTRGKTLANQQGTYAGECVSLFSQYMGQVWGIKTGAWGNAVDYRYGGSGGQQLSARGWAWYTDQSFKDGDILVWGPSKAAGTGAAGHIGIWANGKVYDQNDARHSPARTANYSSFWSSGYLGYWTLWH